MKTYQFKALLQNDGWLQNAFVAVGRDGLIQSITTEGEPGVNPEFVNGYAIPGFQNAHSHAFQYAMAGAAEGYENASLADNFWSWRETMYQLALTMDPEDIEHIASMVYAEMVRHGYTHVAEFHYLHHDKNGKPYNNLAEHGERLVNAAQKAGIKITLVPMFYQKGGFDEEPQERQRRFISKTRDDYWKLWSASEKMTGAYEGAAIGYGIHSLRAVDPSDIIETIKEGPDNLPFHIHIAEQLKEVEDSINYLKQRPIDWLMDHADINEKFHLVHGTHSNLDELKKIAASGAHVILCPSTEGNLGDGIFKLKDFQSLGGKWSIGTDSHIGINPLEELRLLDYGQRLLSHQRNTFIGPGFYDGGAYGVHQALQSGRRAMGNPEKEYFEVGQPLDATVLDAESALLTTTSIENILSTIVYASDSTANIGTMVNGKYIVRNNVHIQRESIQASFIRTIKKLKVR